MKNAELSNLAEGLAALAQYKDVVQPGLLAREARREAASQVVISKQSGIFSFFSDLFAQVF